MVINNYRDFIIVNKMCTVKSKIHFFFTFVFLHSLGVNILCTLDIIIELLNEKNATQKDLCAYLNIKKQTFTNWKNGDNSSYKKYLPQIASFFGVSVDYLLGKTTEQKITAEPDSEAQQLLDIFYSFNNEGRSKLLEQAIMMQSFGAYNADSEIIEIAARSGCPEDVILTDTRDNPDAPDPI